MTRTTQEAGPKSLGVPLLVIGVGALIVAQLLRGAMNFLRPDYERCFAKEPAGTTMVGENSLVSSADWPLLLPGLECIWYGEGRQTFREFRLEVGPAVVGFAGIGSAVAGAVIRARRAAGRRRQAAA